MSNISYPRLFLNKDEIESFKKTVYTPSYMVRQGIGRSYRGIGNNLANPRIGIVDAPLNRKGSAYANNVDSLAVRGSNPSPRVISNYICKSAANIPSGLGLTDMTWMWGQFIDHEITLTKAQSDGETADILTVADAEEDYPGKTISFKRSQFVMDSSPREHPNNISAFLDATGVYGFAEGRSCCIRAMDGTGKMIVIKDDNDKDILPYNTKALENDAPGTPSDFFLAGDIRANENVGLTAIHTIWVRRHNYHCDQIAEQSSELVGKDELIYQYARNIVIGEIQHITYNEFLPAILGPGQLSPYVGYKNDVDAGINVEFSTVGYRVGHTMLSSNLKIGDAGTLSLKDAFFNPSYIQANGIEDIVKGACNQIMQEIDGTIVEDVRSFLFGAPTATNLLDLAALNIQRGRDHGLVDYNTMRELYGLNRITNWSQITSDAAVQGKLAVLYDSVDVIDPWIGGIVEDHVMGAAVGPLFCAIIKDQFERIRDGDRFWYEINPNISTDVIKMIQKIKFSDVIDQTCEFAPGVVPDKVFGR